MDGKKRSPSSRKGKWGAESSAPSCVGNKMKQETPQEKLQSFCLTLGLPSTVCQKAEKLLSQIQPTDGEDEKIILIGILYVAIQESREVQGESGSLSKPAATVSQLLDVADSSIMQFCSIMKSVTSNCHLSQMAKDELRALERKYLIVSALYHKYEKIFSQVTRSEESLRFEDEGSSNTSLHSESLPILLNEKKQLCWMLFLVAKAGRVQNELVSEFYLLLCCVDFVVKSIPGFLLQPPFDSAILEATASHNPLWFLQVLCEQMNSGFDEVKTTYNNIWFPTLSTLQNADGSINISSLKETYIKSYVTLGDIDEMRFLDHDKHLLPSGINNRSNNVSPCKVPTTPVKMALYTIRQLKNMLTSAKDQPSKGLQKFFENCSINPSQSIKHRIETLQTVFVKKLVEATAQLQESVAKERYKLAVRLYYTVLEAMLKSEEERLSVSDFSMFLSNDTFHRALLACSAEVVLTIYGNIGTISESTNPPYVFPWILQVFDLKAYSFCKVLESFIKDAPKITKEIVKHLKTIEDRIIEELAWQSGSPLFEGFHSIQNLPLTFPQNEERTTASTVDLFSNSPKKVNFPQALTIFLHKVGRYMYRRLELMCSSLDIPTELQTKIWTCLDHILTCKPDLMKDRHLDQMLMCSIYALCKVSEKERMFRTIVQVCREVLDMPPRVYKNVFIRPQVEDSIIRFYNNVFMQEMKTFILKFAPNRQGMPATPIPSQNSSPVCVVPGMKNIYISPLKKSPSFKVPQMFSPQSSTLTPRSQLIFTAESPGSLEKLRSISTSARMPNHVEISCTKSQKRLCFDHSCEEGTGEQTSGAKRLHLAEQDEQTSPTDPAANSQNETNNTNQSWAVTKLIKKLDGHN